MAQLLVIGGSGFFGKSILDAYKRGLLIPWHIDGIKIFARNAEILRTSNPELLSESVHLINGDIATCKEIPRAEYVIHAAASTDAARYLEAPKTERQNILAATVNYCSLAPIFHKNSKILYVSSGAVYGQQPGDLKNISEEFSFGAVEDLDISKKDYAAAKRDSERAIHELAHQGLSVSIARCFAFLGKYLPRNQHFAIGNFIEDGLRKRELVVKANKAVIRSYMHADDLVIWLMKVMDSSSSRCPVINVGSDFPIEIRELAKVIAGYFNVPVRFSEVTEGIVDRYVPTTALAKNTLGLTLSLDLRAAIELTIEAIKNQETLHVKHN